MTIGENIKSSRKKIGLSQKQLADKVNISRQYLCDIEHDRYNPSIDTLGLIAKGLETTAQKLMKDDMSVMDEIDELENDFKEIYKKLKKVSPENREKILKMIEIFEESEK